MSFLGALRQTIDFVELSNIGGVSLCPLEPFLEHCCSFANLILIIVLITGLYKATVQSICMQKQTLQAPGVSKPP